MASSRVALVADDLSLAHAIHGFLHKNLGQAPLTCTFANIGNHLGRDTDGVLVAISGSPHEEGEVRRLVQDIVLQKLPPSVVLVDCRREASPRDASTRDASTRLEALDPYVTRRCAWPADAQRLVQLAKECAGRGRGFDAKPDSLEDLLRRRLLAQTPSLLSLVERIALAAAHDVTVLLTGETGTGKTFLARLIHEYSQRRDERFLTVGCGALSASLVESEFFGHVKGAFTGADRPKVGKFAAVGRGTLFLDEIDTLGLEQQATLLRVIETGEFEPVGSVETHTCDARLIVASNLNLEEAVERGKFRPDLFFRLNVMSFHLPPLRERVEDIAPLARGMAARFNRKFSKDLFDVHPEAMAALEAFSWPGNLRQLENVVQQAVLVSSGPELLRQHLPTALQQQAAAYNHAAHAADSLQHQRDQIERHLILRALVQNGYSRARAADSLGISRVTLYKKMKKYGLMAVPIQPTGH